MKKKSQRRKRYIRKSYDNKTEIRTIKKRPSKYAEVILWIVSIILAVFGLIGIISFIRVECKNYSIIIAGLIGVLPFLYFLIVNIIWKHKKKNMNINILERLLDEENKVTDPDTAEALANKIKTQIYGKKDIEKAKFYLNNHLETLQDEKDLATIIVIPLVMTLIGSLFGFDNTLEVENRLLSAAPVYLPILMIFGLEGFTAVYILHINARIYSVEKSFRH